MQPAVFVHNGISIKFVPGGSDDPRKFKDAKGRIIIIGPDSSGWQKNQWA